MKTLKFLFGVKITSFILKFAIDRSLPHSRYERAPIGASLERVLRYHTVKGKFFGVHPDLKEIGIKKIEVDFVNEYIVFIFNDKKIMDPVKGY